MELESAKDTWKHQGLRHESVTTGPRKVNTDQKPPVGGSTCTNRTSAMAEFVVIWT